MNLQEKKLYGGEATNATSRLVEHVTNKKGSEMVELIELAALISQLGDEIKKLENKIGITTNIKQKNELIVVYNKAINELRKAHELQAQKTKKEWNHVLPKILELLPEERVGITPITIEEKPAVTVSNLVEENKVIEPSKINEDIVVPDVKPEAVIASNQNQRGEPNTIINDNAAVEREHFVTTNEAEVNIIDGDKETVEPETKEFNQIGQGNAEEVVPVTEDEFMEQLKTQMEMMLEIDRRIAEIKKENLELEKFIAEQEEIEKEKILKDKALEVIKKAKKEKIKRDDPKLTIFKKEWIDEIYGKGK